MIINEHITSYLQSLQDELIRQILISGSHALIDRPGGIFIRSRSYSCSRPSLLKCVARIIIDPSKGTLETQLHRRIHELEPPSHFISTTYSAIIHAFPLLCRSGLFNTLGGFTLMAVVCYLLKRTNGHQILG